MAEKKPDSERFSLYGIDPEEAIKKMFSTPQERTVMCEKCGAQRISGMALVDDEGNVRCPKCGLIVTIEQQ